MHARACVCVGGEGHVALGAGAIGAPTMESAVSRFHVQVLSVDHHLSSISTHRAHASTSTPASSCACTPAMSPSSARSTMAGVFPRVYTHRLLERSSSRALVLRASSASTLSSGQRADDPHSLGRYDHSKFASYLMPTVGRWSCNAISHVISKRTPITTNVATKHFTSVPRSPEG